ASSRGRWGRARARGSRSTPWTAWSWPISNPMPRSSTRERAPDAARRAGLLRDVPEQPGRLEPPAGDDAAPHHVLDVGMDLHVVEAFRERIRALHPVPPPRRGAGRYSAAHGSAG